MHKTSQPHSHVWIWLWTHLYYGDLYTVYTVYIYLILVSWQILFLHTSEMRYTNFKQYIGTKMQFNCLLSQKGKKPVLKFDFFGFLVNLYKSRRWITCRNRLTLCDHDIIVLAAWTHTEEGTISVHTLGFSTHTAQQLTLIHICGERAEKPADRFWFSSVVRLITMKT